MTVFLDVSAFVADPARTGIQRVERELIKHWPGPARLVPCRFDPAQGGFRQLPEPLLAALAADLPPTGAEVRAVQPFLRAGPPLPRGARLLCAELFADAGRARAYLGLEDIEAAWLVYDFLPWLRPDWFGPGGACALMPYLRALRAVRRVAFISEQTRLDYERVLQRRSDGPVIPLGADGLGLERQRFSRDRNGFLFLGTLEPRKNGALVLQAFEQLWSEGCEASLTVIGKVHPHGVEERAALARLADEPRLRVLHAASDGAIRAVMRQARALVFPSEGEGFGLPAVEALHAGVPAVVAASLPAATGLPPHGLIRLAPVTTPALVQALRRLLDDGEAARLWEEGAEQRLSTWCDVAATLAAWVQGD